MPLALTVALLAAGARAPTLYDRSLRQTARFARMLARPDANRAFTAYVRSTPRSQVIREPRQGGFEYRDLRNGCLYLTGAVDTSKTGKPHPAGGGQATSAFVSFCGSRARIEISSGLSI